MMMGKDVFGEMLRSAKLLTDKMRAAGDELVEKAQEKRTEMYAAADGAEKATQELADHMAEHYDNMQVIATIFSDGLKKIPVINSHVKPQEAAKEPETDEEAGHELSAFGCTILSGPRGKADSLNAANMWPVMEQRLNDLGIYHWWQLEEIKDPVPLAKELGIPPKHVHRWIKTAKYRGGLPPNSSEAPAQQKIPASLLESIIRG